MSAIQPSDPNLLTDVDVNYLPFYCCGDEDLVFLKCPVCQHLMVFCYECDTLYPNLDDVSVRVRMPLTRTTDRFICPQCRQPFEDFAFLMPPQVDKYLVTAEEVVRGGYLQLLSDELQRRFQATQAD
jgi:hypothetical protein